MKILKPHEPAKESIKFGLPKGRFLSYSFKLLDELDYIPHNKNVLQNKIIDNKVTFYLFKASDIPFLVSENILNIGIVPEEWYLEHNYDNQSKNSLVTLGKMRTISARLSFFANKKGNWPPPEGVRIATKFPKIVTNLLQEKGITEYVIIKLKGSIEAAIPDLSDLGFDCVETGQCLKAHNLKVVYTPYTNLNLIVVSNKYFQKNPYNWFIKRINNAIDNISCRKQAT